VAAAAAKHDERNSNKNNSTLSIGGSTGSGDRLDTDPLVHRRRRELQQWSERIKAMQQSAAATASTAASTTKTPTAMPPPPTHGRRRSSHVEGVLQSRVVQLTFLRPDQLDTTLYVHSDAVPGRSPRTMLRSSLQALEAETAATEAAASTAAGVADDDDDEHAPFKLSVSSNRRGSIAVAFEEQ
jgi:hypothetical protein